jgi:CMP/dCMP kinase
VTAGVVAIDGPAGSGKSTVANGVAEALGLRVLDTGAMYRAATLAALDAGVDLADEAAVTDVAEAAAIVLEEGHTHLDGRDVTTTIRGPAVTAAVSVVSAHPGVRKVMVRRQRAWVREHGGGVVEGRDIGTVVLPDAEVKVFLTASDRERARRRQRDEAEAARPTALDAVREAIARRDELDSGREASPLKPAADAVVIDTTERDPADVVAEIVTRFRAARGTIR